MQEEVGSRPVCALSSRLSTLWLSWALPRWGFQSVGHSRPGLGSPGLGCGALPPSDRWPLEAGIQALQGVGCVGQGISSPGQGPTCPLSPHMQLKCCKPAISSSFSHCTSWGTAVLHVLSSSELCQWKNSFQEAPCFWLRKGNNRGVLFFFSFKSCLACQHELILSFYGYNV